MKKLFFAFMLAVFFILLSPQTSLAQNSCDLNTGVNCFHCTWTGIECIVDIATSNCRPGFSWNELVCKGITDPGICGKKINNNCISALPTFCYECVDVNTGCIPRDPNDPRCEYKGSTQIIAFNACDAACKGIVPTRFSCVNGECVEKGNGPYNNIGDCTAACHGIGSDPKCDPPGGEPGTGINTAIGCIPVMGTIEVFLGWILKWAIGIGGGIAFLLIVYAGFMIMTSQGNPERLQAGKELMTSAISGLILLIFSIFILRVIGVDILQIPGFGK